MHGGKHLGVRGGGWYGWQRGNGGGVLDSGDIVTRGRIHGNPSVWRNVNLCPRMRVDGPYYISVIVCIILAGGIAGNPASRYAEAAEHHNECGRELIAITLFIGKQKMIDDIGSGRCYMKGITVMAVEILLDVHGCLPWTLGMVSNRAGQLPHPRRQVVGYLKIRTQFGLGILAESDVVQNHRIKMRYDAGYAV